MRKQRVQREFKDRLFRLIFQDKKDLLALYNAINGSDYSDPEALEINTLEDAIYIGMKNDISFVLDDILNLWEQQSSFNPNMPIRGLSYLAKLYQKYIEERRINVFSSQLKYLPFPQYVVFYNGIKDEPDQMELKLSDAFIYPKNRENMDPCLEVKALLLNINWGNNRELMERCQRLKEYAQFVAKVREYIEIYHSSEYGDSLERATSTAVDICIKEGILSDILSSHKAEVIAMFLTEYNEEKHMAMERDEWVGVGEVMKTVKQCRKKYSKKLSVFDCADMLDEPLSLIQQIYDILAEHSNWTDLQIVEAIQSQK